MPWYMPWSDQIAKRVCKYLLQRYLGQFLEEKLTLDQLNVDLYKGTGTITDVALDVLALNDVAEQQNIPFQFVDGFVEEMSVCIPWASLLVSSAEIHVRGLTLTFKYKERDKSKASMFESMWSSMSSSMQLAEDCLRNEKEKSEEDSSQTFEGIERFAHTIDSILSRIRVKFTDTVLRLEEVLPNGVNGVALEATIANMEYWDEAGERPADEETQQELIVPTFSTKRLLLEGVSFYSDEFIVDERSDNVDNSVLMARLAGSQDISIKFNHDGIAGPKVELTLRFGALTIFASPRQVHKLIHLLQAMSESSKNNQGEKKPRFEQKPMNESDFRKIEQELSDLRQNYQPQGIGLGGLGWGGDSLEDSADFQPFNDVSCYNESVISSTSSLASSTSSFGSGKSNISQPSFIDNRPTQAGVVDADPLSATFRFHVSLASLAVVLLQDDILALSATAASFNAMRRVAKEFFNKLGHFAVAGFGNKDFYDAKKVFLDACQLNHVRLLAAPVIFEGNEMPYGKGSVMKGSLTAASLQLLECLVEKSATSGEMISKSIEILTFIRSKDENLPKFETLPSLKVDFKLFDAISRRDRGRKISQPRSDFSIVLQPIEIEMDITIFDRIANLITLEPFPTKSDNSAEQVRPSLKSVMNNTVKAKTQYNLKVFSSFVLMKIRFPILDMRPMHDMDRTPWWRRQVRSESLLLDLTDLTLQTCLNPLDPVTKYELDFRKLLAKFEYSENEPAVAFASIAADPASNTILDGGRGFGWPRIVFSFHPETQNNDFDVVEPVLMAQSMGYMSLIANLERTQQREISPFSFQRVIHDNGNDDNMEGEQLVTPASKEEIAEFEERASVLSLVKIEISCPTASILLTSKPFYELLYNRVTMDLLMWKPSAPVRDVQNLTDDSQMTQPIFNLCKSAIRCDSESDDESDDGLFHSVAEIQERNRKKKTLEQNRRQQHNRISVSLTVGQGLFDLFLPVRDALGNIIPEQSGELLLAADEVSFFYVSGYNGKKDLDYMCVQGNHVTLYHNGLLTDACNMTGLRSIGSPVPHYLLSTVNRMDCYACPESTEAVGTGSAQSLDMLTGAVKISRDENNRSLKFIRVALGLRNSSLRYRVCESRNIWYNQLIDFFDVDDYPIIGYEPSTVVTELNLHLWNCNIDYRPLHLSLRSILNVGSFNLSSNITAKTNSSTVRFIAEDASFFLSDKMGHRPQTCAVNLSKDYVCVMQLGLLEIFLRLCELSITNPKVDFKASAHSLLIRTCSDSAKALFELISYFVADGDLNTYETEYSTPVAVPVQDEEILVSTDEQPAHLLSKSQVERVNDLMQEAMLESRVDAKPGVKAYFTVDNLSDMDVVIEENAIDDNYLDNELGQLGSDVLLDDDPDDDWENEFCILENEAGIGILPKSGLPEVRQLTPEPPRFVDNHFALPTGRTDHLRSPKHCPQPVTRYTLRELSLLWQMFGGSDFDPPPPPKHVNIQQPSPDSDKVGGTTAIVFSKNNPSVVRFEAPTSFSRDSKVSWQERGGIGRRHDVLMELELKKVQFQHEVYPEHTEEVSRQVLLIKDLEIRDRLASSQINKFLYQYYSEAKPKQAHANMVVIKALQMRSDPKVNAQECCLKVSLLPLRLNIDQDALIFLVQFFTDLSDDNKDEGDHESSAASRNQTPTHAAPPVMSVTPETKADRPVSPPAPLLIQLEETRPQPRLRKTVRKTVVTQTPPSPPVYFRCIIFSPDVPVRLDYQGKHVDLTHGPLAGILMGLGQLNNSELRLKRISHRHGLLGVEKLIQFILNEWSGDMKRNQLPGLLGGVGPIYSLVQLFQGVRDLFWMPIEQYKKDGRLVRGLQRGANSFTTSSAMAVLELTSRLIQLIQSTAETAYDMVSPGPSVRAQRRNKDKRRQYSQPADIREGLAKAILVVKDGIGETASNLVRVANEEHEQKGVTGAVGGVLRQIPPTVVKPIILATEATNNVIGGMRSQLVPDVRKEAVDKWRGNVS